MIEFILSANVSTSIFLRISSTGCGLDGKMLLFLALSKMAKYSSSDKVGVIFSGLITFDIMASFSYLEMASLPAINNFFPNDFANCAKSIDVLFFRTIVIASLMSSDVRFSTLLKYSAR